MAMAPEPVPFEDAVAEWDRFLRPFLQTEDSNGLGHDRCEARRFSTRCSVSGRGISTSGVTRKGRP